MIQKRNLFTGVGKELHREHMEVLAREGRTRIERVVSHGEASPPGYWYDQDESEWVLMVRGHARVRFEAEDQVLELSAGDNFLIPPHVRHRVDWTAPDEDTIWLVVFF